MPAVESASHSPKGKATATTARNALRKLFAAWGAEDFSAKHYLDVLAFQACEGFSSVTLAESLKD